MFGGKKKAQMLEALLAALNLAQLQDERIDGLETRVTELENDLDEAECCGECDNPCGACEPQDKPAPEPEPEPINFHPGPMFEPFTPPPVREYLVYLYPEPTYGFPVPPSAVPPTVTIKANNLYVTDGILILNDNKGTVAIYGQGQWQKVVRAPQTEERVA